MTARFIQGTNKIQGAADGLTAPTGSIGETIVTAQTSIAANNGVSGNITTTTIPSAGIWQLEVTYAATSSGTSNLSLFSLGVSDTSNSWSSNLPYSAGRTQFVITAGVGGYAFTTHTARYVINSSTTPTLYLVCSHTAGVNFTGNVWWKWVRMA